MPPSPRAPEHDRALATALLLFVLVLFAWTHRHALTLPGFADDLGLLAEMPRRAADGSLGSDSLARLTGALWPGNTMWRPVPYLSFALDSVVWGDHGGAWRLTNLALHLTSAALTGWLAVALLRAFGASNAATASKHCGIAAAAVFLLAPWSPEVTLWIVGRFDGWATAAMLFSTLAFARVLDDAIPQAQAKKWALASLIAGVLAYASKESAMVLPVWLCILAAVHWLLRRNDAATTDGQPRAWPVACPALLLAHLGLAAAYWGWRRHLFAGSAASVYGSPPQHNVVALIDALSAHAAFPLGLAHTAPVAALIAAGCALVLLVRGLIVTRSSRIRWLVAIALAFSCCVLLGVTLYLPRAPGSGEGYRLYYLATPGFAIALALALWMRPRRWVAITTVVLLGSLAVWQNAVAREWTRAGREMTALLRALPAAAQRQAAADYTLLLVPDMRGHVPFARNAQGALPMLADRLLAPDVTVRGATPDIATLSRIVLFTPLQIEEWHRLARERVVPALVAPAGRTDSPANPTQFACFDPERGEIRPIGYWSAEMSLNAWRQRWLDAVQTRCPALRG